jgi:signal transduction histidine kinase
MAQALDKRESELKRANEELRQTNRNYMEILGFVTHEIKNRLGIILGSAYNLKSGVVGVLSDGQAKMVDILLRNSERLRDMIKNYLDLSRIERGELQVIKSRVGFLSDVTEPVLAEFEGQLEANETKLEVHVPQDMYLVVDPDLLRVVMENLVSNALKYGRRGGTIRVSAEHRPGYWQVGVWNEGEGIAASEIGQLFTKFTRVGGELRRQQGSGLGLFVTREILEKHGGRIWAESEQGEWANFVFTLPAVEAEPQEKS